MEKDLRKMFRRLMTQSESGDLIFDTIRLEHHATLVMKSIGQAVDAVEDAKAFTEMLYGLGEKHTSYNVKPEMLPVSTGGGRNTCLTTSSRRCCR